ncbi:MAG TPA: HEAT repeat domain-containing protein [Chloroflexota bacterium]
MVLHSLTVTLRRLADPAAALTPDVLESLSNFPEEEAGAFLTAWSRLDEERKIAVLQALAALAEEEYRLDFNTVYRLALEDESPRVRAEAVRVSVDDETEPMLERLLALMRTEVDAAVRERVAVALGRFALRGALGDLPPDRVDEIRQVLLGAFANASEPLAVRQAALGSVGYLDDETVRRAVEQAVEQPSFHVSALRAMGRSADARWLPRVVADLRHPDPAVRAEAARACGEIEDPVAVEPLLDLIDDPEEAVCLAAVEALGHIGGAEAREALVYCLEDPRQAVREAAEEALSEIAAYDDLASEF